FDHAVESLDQVIQLVTGAARGNTQLEIGTGDPLRRLRDLGDRRQRASRENPAEQAASEDEDRRQTGIDLSELTHYPPVISQRAADRNVVRIVVLVDRVDDAGTDQELASIGVLLDLPYGITGCSKRRAHFVRRVFSEFGVEIR